MNEPLVTFTLEAGVLVRGRMRRLLQALHDLHPSHFRWSEAKGWVESRFYIASTPSLRNYLAAQIGDAP